jgi:cold shock CspA family protein
VSSHCFIIPPDDGSEDVFVLRSSVNGSESLSVGEKIEHEWKWNVREGKMACGSCTSQGKDAKLGVLVSRRW